MHNKLPQDEEERYDVCNELPVCSWLGTIIQPGSYVPYACDRFAWGCKYLDFWKDLNDLTSSTFILKYFQPGDHGEDAQIVQELVKTRGQEGENAWMYVKKRKIKMRNVHRSTTWWEISSWLTWTLRNALPVLIWVKIFLA